MIDQAGTMHGSFKVPQTRKVLVMEPSMPEATVEAVQISPHAQDPLQSPRKKVQQMGAAIAGGLPGVYTKSSPALMSGMGSAEIHSGTSSPPHNVRPGSPTSTYRSCGTYPGNTRA